MTYRWNFGRGYKAEDRWAMFIWCEGVSEPGIAVLIRHRDYWLDFSEFNSGKRQFDPDDYKPIKPSLVRELILLAKQWGWQTGQTPKQMVFDYDWEKFTVYEMAAKG